VNPLELEYVKVSELRTFHRNPRQGDVAAIQRFLRVNGQYRPIVVNKGTHTGRKNEVLAGNHTLMASREEGLAEVAVVWVDVDDDQCTRIVAADNRTADLGSYDERLLAEMLGDLPDLDGTGYDPGDLDALIALLEGEGGDVRDDEEVLDDTDRAGWPQIKCQVPPEVHARWLEIEGHDDRERVEKVLAQLDDLAA
jgi:ParB-like chromosome segregation protein Spo0J